MEDFNTRLEELLCQKQQLEDQGVLIGVRLEKAAAGGTASQKAHTDYKYARLRSGKGKLLANGKRSQYVPIKDIPGIEAQIQRGKRLKQVEREIGKVQGVINRVAAQAKRLDVNQMKLG